MPAASVEAAAALLRQAIERPETAAAFTPAAMTAVSSSPAALAVRIGREQQLWQPVLRTHGNPQHPCRLNFLENSSCPS